MKTIPRGAPGDTWLTEGGWRPGRADGRRTASMACPGCGKVASLSGHEIAADGTVTPSVACAYDCGFHEYVQLEGWEP